MAAFFCSMTGVMSTKVVGTKLHSSGWCGSKRSSSGGSTVSNALGTPAPAASARAFSTAKNAAAWSGIERVAVRVGDDDVRSERADAIGDRGESFAVDLERVVAEIEALELGAERGRRALRLRRAGSPSRARRSGPAPSRARRTRPARRRRARARAPRRRPAVVDGDHASRPPDEVGGVRPDHEERARHAAPASRRDCPTIISCTSSSSNPPSSRRSAQSASPSSTGG